jgi:hypothetical protein
VCTLLLSIYPHYVNERSVIPELAESVGIKRVVFSLIIVLMLVVTACSHGSKGTVHPLGTPPPGGWPTTWTGLSTDLADGGGEDHRDVTDTNGDGYALYYATDAQYLYLRMETVKLPGWPSTKPAGDARYKWWFDTAGTDLYVGGTSVYKGEFLLILEDRTDTGNVDGNRDQLGELTLMDDLPPNLGFKTRWNSGGSGAYITGIPDSGANSTLWMRRLGSGTPGTGGPQGVMGADIGYRIDSATTGGNFVDMYISWAALGNPSSLCMIWATDNQVTNMDQAPNLDRPAETSCLAICTPPQAAFNATPTAGCAPLTVDFTDQSTGNITGWNWTFGDGGTSTLQNPSHQYTTAGSYNVTLNVTTACSSDTETKTNYITVYAGSTADAGNDASISCNGGATIGGSPTGSGGTGPYTYNWTPTMGLNDATIANPTASAGGNYTVRVTDANGCWAEDSVEVTVAGAPTADAGPDQEICPGDSVVIGGTPTASGGTSPYTYNWTPTAGLDNPAIANPTASPNSTTIYSMIVTDSGGCQACDCVTVTVHTPTCHISASPSNSVCQGTTVTLTEDGGDAVSWSWSTGGSTQSIQVTSGGTYNVTITDTYGCQSSCQISVTVYDAPTADAGPDKQILCGAGSVLIGGSPTASGGTSPYTYQWAPDTGLDDTAIANPSASAVGTFTVTVTDSNGCQDIDSVTVTVIGGPTANAGGDTGFCAGGSVQLSGSATGGTVPYTYDWTGPENHPNTQNATVSTAGTYTLNVTDDNGCSDTDDVIVSQYLSPTANAGADTGFCTGGSVQLSGLAVGGTEPYAYDWTGPETHPNTQNPTVSTAGTYTLNVTDDNGCSDTDDVIVTQYPSPTAKAGSDQVIISGDSVVIGGTPTASGGTPLYTYSWTPTTGLNDASFANPTASPAVNTTYTVTVTDSNGCTDSDDVTVTVIQNCCICGFVYRAGTTEPLAGWEVILEKHTNPWVEVQSTVTDANGKYCFCGLEAGEYRVSEVVQPNWSQVSPLPNQHLVTLPGGCCDPQSGPFLNFENEQAGPFTVGWETSPIDKLAVLAPWIALFAVIAAGASLLVLRRRRRRV